MGKKGQYKKAIETQLLVIKHLHLALLECSEDKKVTQSINLQIKHHQKQQQLIKLKEARYKRITANLENLQRRMEIRCLQDPDSLQNSINRTFEETESLLAHLRQGTAQQQQEQV